MGEFEGKIGTISIQKLKDFLISREKPCYESELLRIAFGVANFLNIDSLTLYQNHFALFYTLYCLQEEYYKKNKYLHIHFMRTFLINYPAKGKCRFYESGIGKFCNCKSASDTHYCDYHLKQVGDVQIEKVSIKYFYLDVGNYYKLDKETADEFINGTWEILYHYKEMEKSFKILDLPETSSIDMIKKRFKILARQFHPDINSNDSVKVANKKFNEINNAYRLLLKIISKS